MKRAIGAPLRVMSSRAFVALVLAISVGVPFSLPGTVQAQSRDGLALWGQIHSVFSHPRCSNCHVGEDGVPLWSGAHYDAEETPRAHGMFIAGGSDRHGGDTTPCSTCHGDQNAAPLHGPPGAPHWGLPPVEMQWAGRSSREICEQIKNPATNGNRSIEDVADHVGRDALVLWGWDPGEGREPAPYSSDQLVAFILQWDALGAPCPAE